MSRKHGGHTPVIASAPPTVAVIEDDPTIVAPPPESTEKPIAKARGLPEGVTVKNVTKTWFRQPSTGTRIDAGEEQFLKHDGWLVDQISAGHFTRVT